MAFADKVGEARLIHECLRGESAVHEAGKREGESANILVVSVSMITPFGGPDMMQRNRVELSGIYIKAVLNVKEGAEKSMGNAAPDNLISWGTHAHSCIDVRKFAKE
jgi:hypothetical protein